MIRQHNVCCNGPNDDDDADYDYGCCRLHWEHIDWDNKEILEEKHK